MEAAAAFGRPRPVVKTEKPPVRDVSHDDDRDSPSKQQQQQQHLLVKVCIEISPFQLEERRF